jgi:hypothetical protein
MAAPQIKGLGMAALQLGEENGSPAAWGGGGENGRLQQVGAKWPHCNGRNGAKIRFLTLLTCRHAGVDILLQQV